MTEARRLVVIDDSEIMLEVMKYQLEMAGFEVRAVSSLRQFVNAVMDWKPHVIVTDLYMPEMNGAELCTWLRMHVETARTPVVLCSSAPDDELARVARAVGADGFVSKNAGADALPAKLQALCDEILF
ncbi:MAG TPA: response regulator [Kofleriaceae bacterium]|nr:response regulator [Kofleriaceae bacterium]